MRARILDHIVASAHIEDSDAMPPASTSFPPSKSSNSVLLLTFTIAATCRRRVAARDASAFGLWVAARPNLAISITAPSSS